MSRHPLFVLADDLTGAAEIAAIASQAGLRAVVHTGLPRGRLAADVVVCDTDTRLLSPANAARRVGEIARRLPRQANGRVFKKTDSVLRGPVLAELNACAEALGYIRTLLVPCNPSLGRVIRDGRYFLGGKPLHKTAFARDPHHPRLTDDVEALVTSSGAQPRRRGKPARQTPSPTVTCCAPSMRPPTHGVIIGEADTPADVQFWAGHADRRTLPAGGADFFRAWLLGQAGRRTTSAPAELPPGPTILLSGTATPPTPLSPLPGAVLTVNPRRIPTVTALAERIRTALDRDGHTSVALRGAVSRNRQTPVRLDRFLRRLAATLHASRSFRHIVIAGGATAANVFGELGWTKLHVVRVWGPGVVSLIPASDPRTIVTVKPGSYAWPASLVRHFEALGTPALEAAAG